MRCRAKWLHPIRLKWCLLNRSQVGQILIIGSSTNDTPFSRSFSTCSTSLGARRLQQLLQCLLQRVLLKMSLLNFLQV
ncbi:hypothetical protein Godav_009938, partial [Gossypium davidsonii]|nr:hypothetical protein [Gossypium davidsonii]